MLSFLPALSLILGATQCLVQAGKSPSITTDDFSSTATIVPSSSGDPCGSIADAVGNFHGSEDVVVPAEDAYRCLQAVPIHQDDASRTMDAMLRLIQFQSTLAYLKSPPDGYGNDPVDIIAGLNNISSHVAQGKYAGQFDFETDLSNLLDKAFDGHLVFEGMATSGTFTWKRVKAATLAIASNNGDVPKVWLLGDFNTTASFPPSAISQIDGQNVTDFLDELSKTKLFHDADARWNTLSLLQAADSRGSFVSPLTYPNPTTTVLFENGTSWTFNNYALVDDPDSWAGVTDAQSFYDAFISTSSESNNKKRRRAAQNQRKAAPKKLRMHTTASSQKLGTVPQSYPAPFFEHSNPDVGMGGFIINSDSGPPVAVLMLQTFEVKSTSDAREWQTALQGFFTHAKASGAQKVIVDIRDNGGGLVLLGYETFKQFFPNIQPYGASRYRAHQASNVLGTIGSQLSLRDISDVLFSSPFNFQSYVNDNLQDFSDWDDMFGPNTFQGDKFTNLLRYNLSDPVLTSDAQTGIGITITGYGDRANFNTPPYNKDDIVILSDGICSSTCSIFVEMMVQQAGIRTFAIGGRTQKGTMQTVGGTKGSEVLTSQYLVALAQDSGSQDDSLPIDFGINVYYASVNFQDNIRQGQEKQGVPTEFVIDPADCRLWYTPSMYLNVTEVWAKVADVAWGDNGGIDASQCISGISQDQASQSGSPSASASKSNATHSKGAGSTVVPRFDTALLGCGFVIAVSFLLGGSMIF